VEEGTYKKPGMYKELHSSPSKPPNKKRRKEHAKQQEAANCKCKCKHLECVQTANMYSSKASKQASLRMWGPVFSLLFMNFVMQKPKVVIIHRKTEPNLAKSQRKYKF
jgi:hypothetical protein